MASGIVIAEVSPVARPGSDRCSDKAPHVDIPKRMVHHAPMVHLQIRCANTFCFPTSTCKQTAMCVHVVKFAFEHAIKYQHIDQYRPFHTLSAYASKHVTCIFVRGHILQVP